MPQLGERAYGVRPNGGDDAIRPEFPADGPADTSADGRAIHRLHQHLMGLRRRNAWLHRATSTALHLDNQQYLIRIQHNAEHVDVALNLAEHPMNLKQSTHALAADPDTKHGTGQVAPHGWAVLAAPPTR